ncbi:MAG: prenyltransferase/squalene oxidase repeat-containing protein [Kiritimatiellae bacterium]|nr:prenyltransferase/squalene oxidase repeat-containing protein [Kiritimatiellia bacterium]
MKKLVNNLVEQLYGECNEKGWWEGKLSSSALSTSLAVFAFAQVDKNKYRDQIARGLKWLESNVNYDGGWGDTPDSVSNISTTALCWSAFSIATPDISVSSEVVNRAGNWLKERAGSLSPADMSNVISSCYGEDRTFSAPILSMCALAGRLGNDEDAWRLVPQLPFELVAMPRFLLRLFRLSVVSYALPALISIGLLKYTKSSDHHSFRDLIRRLCRKKALKILEKLQPVNGGFLEATPLTSFVVMSLVGAGYGNNCVVKKGVEFLLAGMRDDGSWPIDTNLTTWVTSLAVNALASGGTGEIRRADEINKWLLSQQFRRRNIFTDAAPGGWGWTDLPGGVPDADDTSGVLLALIHLGKVDGETLEAGVNGVKWLLDIQNSDGGVPTFCRGWGKLPFDRSCPDITAHALRALDAWYDHVDPTLRSQVNKFIERALDYLHDAQQGNGRWIPLWFGNQKAPGSENPTYGTAQVIIALSEITKDRLLDSGALVGNGCRWLLSVQNADGGWGGAANVSSSIEETALAVTALAQHGHQEAVNRGIAWLSNYIKEGHAFEPAPIGLYFAQLWYSERLYPLIFAVAALLKEKSD